MELEEEEKIETDNGAQKYNPADVSAMIESMQANVGVDNEMVLNQIIACLTSVVVVQGQQGEVLKSYGEGIDELMDVMENGVLGPFAKAAHAKAIDAIKEKLNGEGHDFGPFAEKYEEMYNEDLLEQTAEKLLALREETAANGEELDEEAWIGDEYAALKAKFEKLGLSPAAAEEKAEEVVEGKADAAAEAPAKAAVGEVGDIDDETIRATLEKLTI